MTAVPNGNIENDVGKRRKTPGKIPQGKSHFGKSSSEYPLKNGITKLNAKENHTDEKLIKKEESVESAPKSRNKIEWESLSQEKLKAIFGPRPARTWFHFDDDSLSEDSDDSDDEETEEPVEKRPRGTAKCSKNCGM
ncbi:uncharacterized protein [Montipora foliosa]|uniref:uncharacterized protein isoform X5 n=1 Tax=Montipora foliosa TaxID=591990 RepID=UPI0035F212CA